MVRVPSRTVVAIGWTCIALESAFVGLLLVSKNMGDDAAGRGLATAWGLVLLPIVAIAAGALFRAQRSGRPGAVWAATLVAALPFLILLFNVAKGKVRSIDRAIGRAQQGRFDDPVLRQVAQAIDAGDTALVRRLATSNTLDWMQRDRWGSTILGHAVRRTGQPYEGYGRPEDLASVRILMESGAPYTPDAFEAEGRLMTSAGYNTDPTSLELMRIFLEHGADPNEKERFDDVPLVLHHNITVAKLELLAAHGADLQAKSTRTDRPQWSALMNAVAMSNWAVATWLLEHGLDPDYRAPDGQTVDSVLAADSTYADYHSEQETAERRTFVEAVAAWRATHARKP
jgi:hypothetical protein